jgi:hypothetical protein
MKTFLRALCDESPVFATVFGIGARRTRRVNSEPA